MGPGDAKGTIVFDENIPSSGSAAQSSGVGGMGCLRLKSPLLDFLNSLGLK
jgi:hypothetical protein